MAHGRTHYILVGQIQEFWMIPKDLSMLHMKFNFQGKKTSRKAAADTVVQALLVCFVQGLQGEVLSFAP